MSIRVLYLLLFLLGLVSPLLAQTAASNQRCKWLPVSNEAVILDTLTIDPATVSLVHPHKEQFAFDYNYTTQEFRLTQLPVPDSVMIDRFGTRIPAPDSVLVCFRVMPLNLTKPAFKRDVTKLDLNPFQRNVYQEDISTKEEIFRTPGLNKT